LEEQSFPLALKRCTNQEEEKEDDLSRHLPVPVYVRRAGERAKVKGLGVTPTHCTLRVVFGLILETGNLYGSVPINQSAVANSAVLIAPPAPYDRESGDGAAMPGSQRHRMHAKV
jgi:hypothetical protein